MAWKVAQARRRARSPTASTGASSARGQTLHEMHLLLQVEVHPCTSKIKSRVAYKYHRQGKDGSQVESRFQKSEKPLLELAQTGRLPYTSAWKIWEASIMS